PLSGFLFTLQPLKLQSKWPLGFTNTALNMMEDAFDDQYLGCAKEMEKKAPELLEKEKSMSSVFSRVWENAHKKWENVKSSSPLRNYEDKYGIALAAYTDSTPQDNGEAFSTTFNEAVESAGTSRAYYMAHFRFKAFHYYLTRALQLLRKECNKVYRGVSKRFKYEEGDIRFGRFASSSFSERVAEEFSNGGTLFTIHTCFGVKIQALSYNPHQEEVLIPVHETFSVSPQGNNRFVLRSTNRTCSHFNCTYLGGEYWAEHEKYLCGAICCGEFENPTSGRADERDADLGICHQGWGRQAATTLAARGLGWGGWMLGPTRSLRKEGA
uniref:NAD(P)(+)--arginine ADP-ribosyltransferase n=1 Tax=Terrapene triunguis TaxID=2587831 RepID=A0A674IC01_9SAUR